jgi:hypothetical protein
MMAGRGCARADIDNDMERIKKTLTIIAVGALVFLAAAVINIIIYLW